MSVSERDGLVKKKTPTCRQTRTRTRKTGKGDKNNVMHNDMENNHIGKERVYDIMSVSDFVHRNEFFPINYTKQFWKHDFRLVHFIIHFHGVFSAGLNRGDKYGIGRKKTQWRGRRRKRMEREGRGWKLLQAAAQVRRARGAQPWADSFPRSMLRTAQFHTSFLIAVKTVRSTDWHSQTLLVPSDNLFFWNIHEGDWS